MIASRYLCVRIQEKKEGGYVQFEEKLLIKTALWLEDGRYFGLVECIY